MACHSCSRRYFVCLLFVVLIIISFCEVSCKADGGEGKPEKKEKDESWKKKDIRDYTEADLERLYEQWEEDEDPLEEDEKPEWEREPPPLDISKLDPNNPEAMLQESKKGRTLMMFASVSGTPTEKETETITWLWQTSLHNANIETQRYVVGSDRVIFMLKDGSKAWFVKDFLVKQDRCSEVTIEGKTYPGKDAGPQESADDNATSKKKKDTDKKKTSQNDTKKSKKDGKKKTEL